MYRRRAQLLVYVSLLQNCERIISPEIVSILRIIRDIDAISADYKSISREIDSISCGLASILLHDRRMNARDPTEIHDLRIQSPVLAIKIADHRFVNAALARDNQSARIIKGTNIKRSRTAPIVEVS